MVWDRNWIFKAIHFYHWDVLKLRKWCILGVTKRLVILPQKKAPGKSVPQGLVL